MIRTFIAIDISEEIRSALGAAEKAMGRLSGVRWCRPAGIHLTLKFIGDIEDSKIPAVLAAMGTAAGGVRPFGFAVKGLGWFPPGRRPRVIWAGVEPETDGLSALVRNLEAALGEVGVAAEPRAYRPHLTLGRARGTIDAATVEEAFGRVARREFGGAAAREIVLYMSELLPTGAEYTRMGAVPLEGKAEEES